MELSDNISFDEIDKITTAITKESEYYSLLSAVFGLVAYKNQKIKDESKAALSYTGKIFEDFLMTKADDLSGKERDKTLIYFATILTEHEEEKINIKPWEISYVFDDKMPEDFARVTKIDALGEEVPIDEDTDTNSYRLIVKKLELPFDEENGVIKWTPQAVLDKKQSREKIAEEIAHLALNTRTHSPKNDVLFAEFVEQLLRKRRDKKQKYLSVANKNQISERPQENKTPECV